MNQPANVEKNCMLAEIKIILGWTTGGERF